MCVKIIKIHSLVLQILSSVWVWGCVTNMSMYLYAYVCVCVCVCVGPRKESGVIGAARRQRRQSCDCRQLWRASDETAARQAGRRNRTRTKQFGTDSSMVVEQRAEKPRRSARKPWPAGAENQPTETQTKGSQRTLREQGFPAPSQITLHNPYYNTTTHLLGQIIF